MSKTTDVVNVFVVSLETENTWRQIPTVQNGLIVN